MYIVLSFGRRQLKTSPMSASLAVTQSVSQFFVEFLRGQSALPLSAARRDSPGSVRSAAVCRPSSSAGVSSHCDRLPPVKIFRAQFALPPSAAR